MPPRKIFVVAGTRPNFMKAAPVLHALQARPDTFEPLLVHTGQHYDASMSDAFLRDLGMPEPHVRFQLEQKTHSGKIAEIMTRFREAVRKHKPDLVIVFGDVNSTIAAAIMSLKEQTAIAHVEAGLRSFDRRMPEELNRILTDHISDLLYTSEEIANRNLHDEGCPASIVKFVGNTMIDSVVRLLPEIQKRAATHGKKGHVVVTLHRQENVDDPRLLKLLLEHIRGVAASLPVVWPIHPRTKAAIEEHGWGAELKDIEMLEPQGYIDFLALLLGARTIVTDSGGVQEETTYLGIPCITLRDNTERPVTVTEGTNLLVPPLSLMEQSLLQRIETRQERAHTIPKLWDGKAAERIVEDLEGWFQESEHKVSR